MTFHVGQKVICVGTFPRRTLRHMWDQFWHPYKNAKKGVVYTVSGLHYDDVYQLHLGLIELPEESDFWCAGYYACGFRPVVSRKTDISIFTAMLTPKKRRVRA